jgi:hypothetical protein
MINRGYRVSIFIDEKINDMFKSIILQFFISIEDDSERHKTRSEYQKVRSRLDKQ